MAAVIGLVFLAVGILGFVPGVTTDFDLLKFAGHDSDAMLLGLFQVSGLHNIVHLAFGVAGLGLATTAAGAIAYLIGGGVIYLAVFVYGLAVDAHSTMNFLPVNAADNWLHLVLAVAMIGLGLVLRSTPKRS